MLTVLLLRATWAFVLTILAAINMAVLILAVIELLRALPLGR